MTKEYMYTGYRKPCCNYTSNGTDWLLTIWKRVHDKKIFPEKLKEWQNNSKSWLGVYLEDKLNILSEVEENLVKDIDTFIQEIKDEDDDCINRCINEERAYVIKNKQLAYKLLIDIDSFIFEYKSTSEIAFNFLKELFNFFQFTKNGENFRKKILGILNSEGIDTSWLEKLENNRHILIHETCPTILIYRESEKLKEFKIAVKKFLDKDIKDPNNIIDIEQLIEIYHGFKISMITLHNWINNKINQM